jgi:hypothetical protein
MSAATIITDYAALVAARATLEAMAGTLLAAAWDAPSQDAACLATVSARCELAADAIFTALNGAASYLGDHEAYTCMFPDESVPATAAA